MDPKGFTGNSVHNFNRYAYGNDNPYRYSDSDGNDAIDSIRSAVPGVIAWDNAQVAWSNSDARGAVLWTTMMVEDQLLFVGTLGLSQAVNTIKASARTAIPAAASLESRVGEIHGALDPIAARQRTTAVLETAEGARVVAGGARDLTPAQRAALASGEVAAKSPGAHAEVTALEYAEKNGLIPSKMEVSRPICPECKAQIEQIGGHLTSPTSVQW